MSGFIAPDTGIRYHPFGEGGGRAAGARLRRPVPRARSRSTRAICAAADAGTPIAAVGDDGTEGDLRRTWPSGSGRRSSSRGRRPEVRQAGSAAGSPPHTVTRCARIQVAYLKRKFIRVDASTLTWIKSASQPPFSGFVATPARRPRSHWGLWLRSRSTASRPGPDHRPAQARGGGRRRRWRGSAPPCRSPAPSPTRRGGPSRWPTWAGARCSSPSTTRAARGSAACSSAVWPAALKEARLDGRGLRRATVSIDPAEKREQMARYKQAMVREAGGGAGVEQGLALPHAASAGRRRRAGRRGRLQVPLRPEDRRVPAPGDAGRAHPRRPRERLPARHHLRARRAPAAVDRAGSGPVATAAEQRTLGGFLLTCMGFDPADPAPLALKVMRAGGAWRWSSSSPSSATRRYREARRRRTRENPTP